MRWASARPSRQASLLAQHWAERRRTLLVICPANLRKQWSQELLDKFFLPSVILEAKTFNEALRAGNLNPFQQPEIVICSFQFARSKGAVPPEHSVESGGYRRGPPPSERLQTRQQGRELDQECRQRLSKGSADGHPACRTPFWSCTASSASWTSSPSAISAAFARSLAVSLSKADFDALKQRLRPICQRTLRRQVLAYVPIHQPARDGAGVLPKPRRAAALRTRLRLPHG